MHKAETKAKIKAWAKENLRGAAAGGETQASYEANPRICEVCSGPIPWTRCNRKKKKTCSVPCRNKLRSQIGLVVNKGTGGKRHGSGRGKKGRYKGIWCGSTFELAFVYHALCQGQIIERYRGFVDYTDPKDGKQKKYYPDFVIAGQVYEIKGYVSPTDRAKLAACPFEVQLITGKELEEIFQYIEKVEGISRNNLDALYE
jgi:hypothetical protein